jgi:hypothetical protein
LEYKVGLAIRAFILIRRSKTVEKINKKTNAGEASFETVGNHVPSGTQQNYLLFH